MAEWRDASVAELQAAGALLVEDGNHGEYRPRPDEFVGSGVAFIRAADMDEGRVLFSSASKINNVARKRITKGVGAPGDVLLSHKGTVGKVALVGPDAPAFVCSPQTTFWRTLDNDVIDRRYLYAYLRSRPFHDQLATFKGETDMADYVSLTNQRTVRVVLPPISVQRVIADSLGALDDKIDLNRRTNETLEALARALFKSWFVDFDPVRAKAEGRAPAGMDAATAALFPSRLVETAEGEVPEGWAVGTIADAAKNAREQVQPSDVYYATPYVGLEHMARGRLFLDEAGVAQGLESQKSRFDSGDILFGKLRPYFKKVALAPSHGVCSTDILVLRPAEGSRAFTLLLVASDPFIEHAVSLSDGTRMPRTSWEQLCRYPVAVPPSPLRAALERVCTPLFDRAQTSRREAGTLAAVRDALLPRLLSGELRVNADDQAPEAAP